MSSKKGERRPRRRFTDEFKAEAVRLVEESGGNIAKVARELNEPDPCFRSPEKRILLWEDVRSLMMSSVARRLKWSGFRVGLGIG